MKKFFAILFLTIFLFQLLPVRAIGKMLWDNQMTEEVHQHCEFEGKITPPDHDKFWYVNLAAPVVADTKDICYRHAMRDEALIKCLHLDVPVQPPNH